MRKTKMIAVFMCIVMMFVITPFSILQATAEGIRKIDLGQEEIGASDWESSKREAAGSDEAYIEKELIEKRTATSKQFLLDDGTVMVQNFGVPVHYEEDDGFKEIDNSLELKSTQTGAKYFENTANSFKVRLFENLNTKRNLSIENKGYRLEFALNHRDNEDLNTAKAKVYSFDNTEINSTKAEKISHTEELDYSNQKLKEPLQPKAGESTLVYENVFQNVDFEYSVHSWGVKENIVLHAPLEDYGFRYTITAPGLHLSLTETGEIMAHTEEGDAIFIIPAPNMSDADGCYSEDVYYNLACNENGTYDMEIIASKSWIDAAERVFPVKIDPAVYSLTWEDANGLTLYYSEATPEYNQPRVYFGKVNSVNCDALISFPNKSDQFYLSGYQLAYSKLRYYVRSVGTAAGATEYDLRTTQTSVPLGSVSSLFDIEYDSTILLNKTIQSNKIFSLSHEERWEEAYFNPETFEDCPDMAFIWCHKSANDAQHGEIDVRSGNLPSVLNYYVSTVGVKEDLPYEQFEYKGGSAYINLINGAVTASLSVLSIDVPTNPISLELVYNDDYDEIMTEFGMHKMFGNNMKLNFQQAILSDTRAVRYIDEDGSIDTLGQDISSNNFIYHSINRNIAYKSDDNSLYVGSTKKMCFYSGKLEYISDISPQNASPKRMYEITYSGDKITQISGYTDNTKTHYIEFTYNGDLVSYAKSYVASSLNSATFQALARCDFIYDSDENLIQIKNYESNNKKFALDYSGGQLHSLTDFDGNGYLFGRTHWSVSSPVRISVVNSIYGSNATYSSYDTNDYVLFTADARTTSVSYRDSDGNILGTRYISRRFHKGGLSEWFVDDKNNTSVCTVVPNVTGDNSREFFVLTQNTYYTQQKQNVTLSESSVAPGSSAVGTISADHGVAYHNGRQYCISFRVETFGSTFVEIRVNGAIKGNLSMNGATKAYYIIPISYVSGTASIQIKNTGNNGLSVSDASYNECTGSQITKRCETLTILNYVSSAEFRGKDFVQVQNYDFAGKITSASETDYSGASAVTRNYEYTYSLGTLLSITQGAKVVSYQHTSSGMANQKTTVVTTENQTKLSTVSSEINGMLGDYYTVQTENGISTRIDYGIKGGNIRPYLVTSDNSVVQYAYNYDGEITATRINGVLMQKTTYSNGKESGYSIANENYSLVRSSEYLDRVTGINHSGCRMLTIGYNGNGDIELTTYANGATIDYNYDNRRLTGVELKDSPASDVTAINFGYTGNDITSVTQLQNDVAQLTYQFSESDTEDVTTVSGAINASYSYLYHADTGYLTGRTLSFDLGTRSRTRIEAFEFDGHGVLQSHGDPGFRTEYTYDALERLETKTQKVGFAERQKLKYTYLSTADYQTGRISGIQNLTNNTSQTYGYNARGFLSSYTNTLNGDSYSYTYDAGGRLLSDGTKSYTYDSYNNLRTITSGGETTTLHCHDSARGTRITDMVENGTSKYFTYDSMGNMTTYKGSSATSAQNLYWTRGNMLSSGSVKAGKNFSYQYGPDNLRYKKTVNNTETLYFWDGDTLIGESDGVNDTQYVYDGSGIAGMLYNGAFLYFEKNLFGDVLKAYNMSGTEVANFRYDSYGNIISQSGSLAHAVKMRYRGYYWDEETGFYYLQSRYYDPSICRFISADQYELLPTLSASLGELNLYAYCSNNPVMYTDESGEGIVLTLAIVFGVIGAIAGGVHMGMKAYNAGYEGWDLAGAIIAGALLGGVIGAGLGAVIGMAAPGIATFLGSSFTLFNTVSAAGELVSVSVTGAQLVATGVAIGLVMFSKHRPQMTHKPPFTWVTQEEGIQVMRKYNGNANKAAEEIMNNHFDIWKKGAGQDYNVIKKWLDRIIRGIFRG